MPNKKQFVFKVSKDEEHGFPVYHMENGFSSVADAIVFGVHDQEFTKEGRFNIVSTVENTRFYPVPAEGMTFINGKKLIYSSPSFVFETIIMKYDGKWYRQLGEEELW